LSDPDPILRAYCTTSEAARLLGVSLRTIQLWTEAGLLEARKTAGGHRRISRGSVESLLHKRTGLDAPQSMNQPGLRILIVEDDVAVRSLYERVIARWPMPRVVETASDGIEALVKIGMMKPDLLITDLNMPEMDGFRMLRQLRSIPALADMTVVVVTGLDPVEIERRGGVPEGIPVLPKPVPFDRLRDIATVLADRALRSGAPTESIR